MSDLLKIKSRNIRKNVAKIHLDLNCYKNLIKNQMQLIYTLQ